MNAHHLPREPRPGPSRHLPVRPNLAQLKQQAKDLLRAVRRETPAALAEWELHHPNPPGPGDARLSDAQLALARSYGVATWPRLVRACRLIDAIWRDDPEAVTQLVRAHPELLTEPARGLPDTWGPPLSYAANLGRDRVIETLSQLGAADVQHAFDRACLQGQVDTAERLVRLGARLERGIVMGPAETQSGDGMAFLLERGAELCDADGDPTAPVAMVLETYCRNPVGKHRCLELFVEQGVALPDTAPMAVHRGRIDLLERLAARDPEILSRTFSHEEIYPPHLGCHADPTLALHGTPLAGATLLHMCVDFDELAIVKWLLRWGLDPDLPADIDPDGFGGHTALFGCVVSQPYRVGLRRDDVVARLFLDAGADPGVRASLRKRLRFVSDESLHEYRDVTPVEWGRRFHDRSWVNPQVLDCLTERS